MKNWSSKKKTGRIAPQMWLIVGNVLPSAVENIQESNDCTSIQVHIGPANNAVDLFTF